MNNFYVYTQEDGGEWLADDEHSWTSRMDEAAIFTRADLALDIGTREAGSRASIMVLQHIIVEEMAGG